MFIIIDSTTWEHLFDGIYFHTFEEAWEFVEEALPHCNERLGLRIKELDYEEYLNTLVIRRGKDAANAIRREQEALQKNGRDH